MAFEKFLRLLKGTWIDPGERHSILWHTVINLVLASPSIPVRARVMLYRAAGMKIAVTAQVRSRVSIRSRMLEIGPHSTINEGCLFDNRSSVVIGKRVGIGVRVAFITSDHRTDDPMRRAGPGVAESIFVEDGVFIGSNVTVLSGVTIGRGTVIGAGAVVTTSCRPNGFYAGVPARRLRELAR